MNLVCTLTYSQRQLTTNSAEKYNLDALISILFKTWMFAQDYAQRKIFGGFPESTFHFMHSMPITSEIEITVEYFLISKAYFDLKLILICKRF